MRIGTPGFVGSRLVEAREARGLTAIALADALDVTRSAVSQWESDEDGSPSPDHMRAISQLLEMPVRFFLEKPRNRVHGPIFHRSRKSTTKLARNRAKARYEWLRDIVDYARGYVKFPAVKFPDFNPPADPAAITDEMIREYAIETRRHWGMGLGPISNVTWLLENCGAVVSRYSLRADELDAFSEWGQQDGTPYVVLNSEKKSAARSRFDVGHELGHLVLHRNVPSTTINTGDYFNLTELQAHRFAGEFLLPRESFSAEFYSPSLDSFASLQPKWNVSIAFMITRSFDIGLISEDQKASLFRNYARRGWKTHEPFDDQAVAESPRLLRRSIEIMINGGAVTAPELLHQLIYSSKDIETLSCLPQGFLDRASREFGLVELRGRGGDVRDDTDVIPFSSRN